MDLCSILPVNKMEWAYENPRVMLLTHLIERYPSYVEEALKHPNVYKILDNSLIELKGALNMERLVAAADKIKADEIIIPDSFLNGEETVKLAKESIQWLKDRSLLGKYKIMAVAHGKNKEEWKQCFFELNSMPEIDVIGVPKVTASWLESKNRGELAPIFMKTQKEIHLLGSWYNLNELLELGSDVWNKVRSADTCLPALYVIQDKHIWEDREGTIDLEADYKQLVKEKYDAVMEEFEKGVIRNYLYNPHLNKYIEDEDERYFLYIENFN